MASPSAVATSTDLVPAFRDDLCLDFANTRFWRGSDPPTEQFQQFADVLDWAAKASLLAPERMAAVRQWWQAQPELAAAALQETLALREAIYRIFYALAENATPAKADLDRLNQAIEIAPPRAGVVRLATGFAWRLQRPATPDMPGLLAPVVWSAGDLLVGPRLARARRCANERCLYLFVDDSKSGTRRWCSMSSCGNRAKAHRHYVRKKQG